MAVGGHVFGMARVARRSAGVGSHRKASFGGAVQSAESGGWSGASTQALRTERAHSSYPKVLCVLLGAVKVHACSEAAAWVWDHSGREKESNCPGISSNAALLVSI